MTMFGSTRAFSGFAVGDLQAAQKFYGDRYSASRPRSRTA